MIRLEAVWYRYPGQQGYAVMDVSLELREGGSLALYGPNGSGKTTILKLAAQLLRPSRGRITAWGRDPWASGGVRGRVVYVHEKPVMLSGTVEYNVAYGLLVRGLDRREALEKARSLLEQAGLEHLAGRRAKGLSTGQKAMTALLRALAVDPRILLLDEPLANMDMETRRRALGLLREYLARGGGLAVASHDVASTSSLVEEAVWVEDGRVRLQGRPREILEAIYRGTR